MWDLGYQYVSAELKNTLVSLISPETHPQSANILFSLKKSRFANFEIHQKFAKHSRGAVGATGAMEREAESEESAKKEK